MRIGILSLSCHDPGYACVTTSRRKELWQKETCSLRTLLSFSISCRGQLHYPRKNAAPPKAPAGVRPEVLGVVDDGRPSQQHRLRLRELLRLFPLEVIDAFLLLRYPIR